MSVFLAGKIESSSCWCGELQRPTTRVPGGSQRTNHRSTAQITAVIEEEKKKREQMLMFVPLCIEAP